MMDKEFGLDSKVPSSRRVPEVILHIVLATAGTLAGGFMTRGSVLGYGVGGLIGEVVAMTLSILLWGVPFYRKPPIVLSLRARGWSGKDAYVCRPMFEGDPAHNPWLVLGRLQPGRFEPLERGKLDRDEEELFTLARETIERMPAKWLPLEGLDRPMPNVRACEADPTIAAEKILDPHFIRSAAAEIGNSPLLAAVPARGTLLVFPPTAEMLEIVLGLYTDAEEEDRISPHIYMVKDGVVSRPT